MAGAAGGAVRQRVQPQARTCPAVHHHSGMLNTEVETGCPWPLHTIPPPSLVVASYRACLQTSPIDIGLSYFFLVQLNPTILDLEYMDVHIQLYPNPVESKCKIQLDLRFFPNPIPGVPVTSGEGERRLTGR